MSTASAPGCARTSASPPITPPSRRSSPPIWRITPPPWRRGAFPPT
nr:MAG TPA: hypothetical protein [Caudoviricetes sp.]